MILLPDNPAFLHPSPLGGEGWGEGELSEHYIVSHGKSGALGSYAVAIPLHLGRGERVVLESPRGLEVGTVLCPASIRQARLLGAVSTGTIQRPVGPEDEIALVGLEERGRRLFNAARDLARQSKLPLEILDVDMLLDGRAILQFVGPDVPLDDFVHTLNQDFALDIRLENLALPAADHNDHAHGGCGKPDCGRSAGGACATCGSGGGCSSCGSGKVDMRAYFGHLREKMENGRRTPLV